MFVRPGRAKWSKQFPIVPNSADSLKTKKPRTIGGAFRSEQEIGGSPVVARGTGLIGACGLSGRIVHVLVGLRDRVAVGVVMAALVGATRSALVGSRGAGIGAGIVRLGALVGVRAALFHPFVVLLLAKYVLHFGLVAVHHG